MKRKLMAAGLVVILLVVLRPDRSKQSAAESEPGTRDERSDDVGQKADAALQSALGRLGTPGEDAQARQILADLEKELFGMPSAEAAEAILRFLQDPDRDEVTGLPFAVAPGGGLASAPSLRVALLDWLGRLDPEGAVEMAEVILSTSRDPDEWAVCLRNKALHDSGTETREFLENKTVELITRPEWRDKPTVGYLEAFDVLVHTRATSAVPLLSDLVAQQEPQARAVAHAAFLTLDRLALVAPAETLGRLADDQDLSRERPKMLAQVMARADLRDPAQLAELESYLLDASRSTAELDAFAAIFPNSNFMISDNLLTRSLVLSGAEMDARDRAALAVMDRWIDEPKFARQQERLAVIRQRLARQLTD